MQSDHAVARPVPLARPHRRIQPSRGLIPIDFGELWRYRELLYRFLWRDFKARYKQTYLGPFWAIFRPLVSIVLFSVIFGSLAKIGTGSKGVPYPLFALGLLSLDVLQLGASLDGRLDPQQRRCSRRCISRASMPRFRLPSRRSIDLALTMIIAVGLFVYYKRLPSWHLVLMPIFILLALVVALGLGLWFTGVMVRYRDAGFALPFVIQIGHVPHAGRVSGLVHPRRTSAGCSR